MATLGKTATPNSSTHGWINNSNQQVGMLFTVPSPGGIFTSVSFWAAGDLSDTALIHGMIWSSTGSVLASGPGVTTSGGHQSNPGGDGSWHTDNLTTPVYIRGGTQIYIGWQPHDSSSIDWAYNGGDHSPNAEARSASGSPTSFAGHTTESPAGAVAAYATYTPGAVYGSAAGGDPALLQEVYGNHSAGAPVQVIGVYRGPSGGGSPVQIW